MSADSKTPRTDAALVSAEYIRREMDYYAYKFVLSSAAEELETDLTEAKARIADLQGALGMAGLKVAELEAENEVIRSLYLNEQGRSESLWVDAERYRWMKREVKRIPPGWGIIGWDAAIDAERGKK
ncbi:hypothetical protein UFOVP501_22 [uncultured Caudovirales phage]|uniref:Uncharacterized protein n=1 Tax=uncultured Caudovirales phage TaxID=2100421 RepID=A0A6J5R696_9CAUD|nr:hypothetical protein UFOVP501_22 [uncultured Caudovirales phage]CAB4161066.1 hypothetical protein UFOVP762_29 [uncultured Caudovirales phage]CAB4187204.1 hypothetical protein UFOVP1161_22 [uncultured Caudovirales phage]